MKLIPRALLTAPLLAGALVGCTAVPQSGSDHPHAAMGSMDMQAHCEMHKKMMSGKTSDEQQALMQERMKSMSAEMRHRMQTMHEQCK